MPPASTRPVVIVAIAFVVLGLIGAVQAGLAGADFMLDLEEARPALVQAKPVTTDPGTPRLARRVFLVIVDGLRFDKSYELPFFDELRRRGVDLEASSHYPTWSRPNYVSILTGVPPLASGVRTNHHTTPVLIDSLMDRIHASGMRVATATDYDALPRVFLRPRGQRPADAYDVADLTELDDERPSGIVAPDADLESPFDDGRYVPWPGGFTEAGTALAAGSADLVVFLVGAPDAAGHAKGGASPEYREAVREVDHALSRALARIDLTLDAVVITSDHGHTDRGGHGGIEPEVVAVPLILAGAGVRPGAGSTTAPGAQLIDVAPTVAALLGIAPPGHGLGRTLVELLALDDTARQKRLDADAMRLAVNRAIVARASQLSDALVNEHRTGRIALVIGGAILSIGFVLFAIRRKTLRLRLRTGLVVIPAFFVAYFGLIGTIGRFSPSLLPANAHMAGQLAKYGLVAMGVLVGTSMWALRNRPTLAARLAEANGIAWIGLMATMIPAGLLWALFPPPYVTVPGPVFLVVIPAVQVAVAAAAAGVALMLALEVFVFGSRALGRPG
ncbi:MAG: alkaline phosphatase family protein [Proteobacteria bacterium]|nr:alkaline phosphatase family protein [Pseudomonadota bacterium]